LCIEVKKGDNDVYFEYGDDFVEVDLKGVTVIVDKFEYNIDKYEFMDDVLLFELDGKTWLCNMEFDRLIEG